MPTFCDDQSVLFQLTHRILCDSLPPRQLEVVYLFDETAESASSVIDQAFSLYKLNGVRRIALNNEGHPAGSISYDKRCEELITGGVVPQDLVAFKPAPEFRDPKTGCYSTNSEADGFVRFIKEQGYTLIGGIRQPLFQIRGFVSLVSALFRHGLQEMVRAYNIPGRRLSWIGKALHSQGNVEEERWQLLERERDNIFKYCEWGHLVTAPEVLQYLKWRDGL